jgi:hypothetical protein
VDPSKQSLGLSWLARASIGSWAWVRSTDQTTLTALTSASCTGTRRPGPSGSRRRGRFVRLTRVLTRPPRTCVVADRALFASNFALSPNPSLSQAPTFVLDDVKNAACRAPRARSWHRIAHRGTLGDPGTRASRRSLHWRRDPASGARRPPRGESHVDAIGCQKKIAPAIIESAADSTLGGVPLPERRVCEPRLGRGRRRAGSEAAEHRRGWATRFLARASAVAASREFSDGIVKQRGAGKLGAGNPRRAPRPAPYSTAAAAYCLLLAPPPKGTPLPEGKGVA